MILTAKNKIIHMTEIFHLKIFGHAMGSEMRKFLTNLGITMASTIFTGVVMLSVNIVAGRLMGPVEYGKYQLVYSIANILIVFILLGINISVGRKDFTAENNEAEKGKIIGTSLWFTIINMLFLGIALYFLKGLLLNFNVSPEIIYVAIFFSMGLALYNLTKSFFQAEHNFIFIAKYEIVNYIAVSIFFSAALFFGSKGFEQILYALTLGCFLFSSMTIYRIRKHIFNFDFKTLRSLMRYGFLAFVVITSGLLISSFDRIIINGFMGQESLGIYSAYVLSSSIMIMFIVKVFSLVFFPAVAKTKDKNSLVAVVKKINRLEKLFILPIFIFNLLAIFVFMKLYGSKYDFNVYFLILVATGSTLSLFTYIRQWFLAAIGERGIKISLQIVAFTAILSVVYYISLVREFHLLGAFIALFLVNLTFYIFNNYYINKNYRHV